MFLEAISELQREFDLVSADERSVGTARLLMELCLLRRTLLLFALFAFSASGVSVPGVSGTVRRSTANRIPQHGRNQREKGQIDLVQVGPRFAVQRSYASAAQMLSSATGDE
jgi:hypothetical protein